MIRARNILYGGTWQKMPMRNGYSTTVFSKTISPRRNY